MIITAGRDDANHQPAQLATILATARFQPVKSVNMSSITP